LIDAVMAETVQWKMVEFMPTTVRRKGPTLAKTARMGHPTSKAQSTATLLQEVANRVYNAGNLFAGSRYFRTIA
jgi:hypothetical protein